MLLFFWPDYRKGNPYQKALYSGFPTGTTTCGPLRKAIAALEADSSQNIFFHNHWTHWLFKDAQSDEQFKDVTADFLQSLDRCRELGGLFVWTVHNAGSHESAYADLERKFHEELARRADLVLVHESSSIDIVRKEFRLIESRVRILPHGNYLSAYPNTSSKSEARKKLNIVSEKPVFGLVGMLRPYKGVEEFIQAVGKTNKNTHQINAFVAGRRVSPYAKGDIEGLAKGITGLWVNEAFIPDEDLHYYLNAADFIVLSYRRILTSGSVLLAASFARPVLLPKLESFRDLFDLPFVFTYEPENIDDMATRMVELGHLSEAELDVISQAALNWAKVRDWQTISNQLDKYLGEIKHARNSVDVHICEGGIDHQIQVYDQETNGQLYDIALCVVNYRSIGDLRKLQRSLQRNVKVRWRMLILDNSEQDTEFKQLKRDFPDAVLVKPEENLGYAAGNNVLMALAKNAGFPVIGILNPDVYLEKDCVSAMVEAVQGAPRSLHSPVVTKKRKDGSPAISFFTSCISSDKGALALSHPLTGRHVGALSDQIQESDSLCGCSMFFSPAILDKYGYMPEEYFLYFEETAWTYAIKQQGGKLIAHPNARIVHTKASQKKGLPALPYIYYMVRNSLIFAQRFGFDVKQTERKYKETFIKHWQVQVDSAAPEYGMFFKRLCEIAQEDGKKGITGKVDIAQRLESAGRKGFRKSVGFLESMDSHTINGWVGEKNWLFATLPSLLVFMDGQYAGSFTPDIEREDIKNLGYKLKSGFQFQHKRHAGFYDTRVDIFNARTGRPLTHIEQTDN